MAQLKYWVWLSAKDLRTNTRYQLINFFGDPEKLYFAEDSLLSKGTELTEAELAQLRDKSLDRANKILEDCERDNVSILTITDSGYPERLRNIPDPPVVLYVKGRLPVVDDLAAIGMVGTRKATPYGIRTAKSLGGQITAGGGLVVTGLATGVDSAAAEGALTAGGSCIGVLGCGIDEVYPRDNVRLYKDVAAVGALVSEYPPGAGIKGYYFPRRNRIISGLSVGVVIIEAPKGSGALITANLALEQGREVFAVPGNIDAVNCQGSNALIQDGAALVTNGWDVLSEFSGRFELKGPDSVVPVPIKREEKAVYSSSAPAERRSGPREEGSGFAVLRQKNQRKNERKGVDKAEKREYIDLNEQLKDLSEAQLKIVSAIDSPSKHIDDIIEASGLPAAAVLSELTILQIKGYVTQESGKRFSLNVSNIS